MTFRDMIAYITIPEVTHDRQSECKKRPGGVDQRLYP